MRVNNSIELVIYLVKLGLSMKLNLSSLQGPYKLTEDIIATSQKAFDPKTTTAIGIMKYRELFTVLSKGICYTVYIRY